MSMRLSDNGVIILTTNKSLSEQTFAKLVVLSLLRAPVISSLKLRTSTACDAVPAAEGPESLGRSRKGALVRTCAR